MFGTLLDRNRPRTVVFYGRVSTEHEAQLSALENQMQWYEDIAKRFPNWNVVDRYIDEGITGTQAKKRPAFVKMIEDSKTGKFDLIVTREVCRFARNTVDTLTHTRELRNKNIEVYFVDDNIWTMDGDGELRLTIMATLAQEESRKVSERVKAGQHISREKNVIYGNGNIFGYELKRNIDENGKWNPEENTYVIIPDEAETIRMIYDMYEQGNGCMKIAKAMLEAHRKNASGLVKWTAGSVSAILKNATYKGYHAYYQSHSNNYLEQKRIQNNDMDTYEYKKGNWEPIISERQWDRVQELRKSKYIPTLVQNGEAKTHSRKISSDVWVRKLRCSCGSKFRKNRYHKDNEGNVTYNYVCYNQVNNGKASQRAKNGLDTEGYCDETPITEWKMNMMGELFLKNAWESRKDDLLVALEYIKAYYKGEADKNKEHNIVFINAQIEKLQKKITNLLDMLAEGTISKEDYTVMRKSYDAELANFNEQKEKFVEQRDTFDCCMNDISVVTNLLASMAELSSHEMSEAFIDKTVSSIIADGNSRYNWNFNLGRTTAEQSVVIVAEGNKNRPNIHLDDDTEASDDGASDLHTKNSLLSDFVAIYPQKLSLLTMLHRLHSSNDRRTPFKTFIIGFEEAKAFRKAQGSFLRANQWSDLTVDVYLEY